MDNESRKYVVCECFVLSLVVFYVNGIVECDDVCLIVCVFG